MPIRPENRARYPKTWKQMVASARERSGNRCECDGKCGEDHEGGRCTALNGEPHPDTGSIVVLTLAHEHGVPLEETSIERMFHACQRCHNRYDAPMRREGIRQRAFEKGRACRHVRSRRMTARSELQIQTLFRSRLRMRAPAVVCVAIPNAAVRGQKALNQARREGAAWGFPDVMCLWAGGVAFIEFKSAKGVVAERQQGWLDRLNSLGHPASVQRDADEALEWLAQQGAPFMVRGGKLVSAQIPSDLLPHLSALQLLASRCPTPEMRKQLIVAAGCCEAIDHEDCSLLIGANMLETA